jgi:peptidoglycan hydrolase-like protein with peptidoglycan-binding domain
VLGVGNQGYAVRTLQLALNACRGAGLATDGIYGSATKNAVKSVQLAYGLTADGVYGPVTRSKPIFPALSPHAGCYGFSY